VQPGVLDAVQSPEILASPACSSQQDLHLVKITARRQQGEAEHNNTQMHNVEKCLLSLSFFFFLFFTLSFPAYPSSLDFTLITPSHYILSSSVIHNVQLVIYFLCFRNSSFLSSPSSLFCICILSRLSFPFLPLYSNFFFSRGAYFQGPTPYHLPS
jgi:hypothetical protein